MDEMLKTVVIESSTFEWASPVYLMAHTGVALIIGVLIQFPVKTGSQSLTSRRRWIASGVLNGLPVSSSEDTGSSV